MKMIEKVAKPTYQQALAREKKTQAEFPEKKKRAGIAGAAAGGIWGGVLGYTGGAVVGGQSAAEFARRRLMKQPPNIRSRIGAALLKIKKVSPRGLTSAQSAINRIIRTGAGRGAAIGVGLGALGLGALARSSERHMASETEKKRVAQWKNKWDR